MGLGNRALQCIPTRDDLRLDVEALGTAIARDRAAGFQPACVIGNAGTVNTGAIDDLQAIADLAVREGLWFHVDGCIGALIAIAPDNRDRVRGLERADSVALDPHKWLHAPFEVGCVLVRDAAAHLASFSGAQEYLGKTPRGLAAADWLYEYGLQTSQIVARTTINIVCFRYRSPGLDEDALRNLNLEIMMRLQEEGIAAISDTTIHGRHCLRAAINNHRTRRSDLDLLVREVVRLGRHIVGTV
jgi:aromatic-L-amino-acid/L-tryptophan decarboxylase